MFVKATKKRARLRLGLSGPSGSGKTYTGLAIGTTIAKAIGKRLAVIDTENESASKYADKFDFDVLSIQAPYTPDKYIKAILDAEAAGYGVILIDSITHAWAGAGGVLEIVDNAGARAQGNKFAGWRIGTPLHNEFVDAMVHCKIHLIATIRSKSEYVLEENDKGKKVPRKVGMAPIQRDGMEYEFDAFAEMDMDHALIVGKTRCSSIDGLVDKKPGEKFAKTLLAWLQDGVEAAEPAVAKGTDEPANNEITDAEKTAIALAEKVMDIFQRRGASESDSRGVLEVVVKKRGALTAEIVDEILDKCDKGQFDKALKVPATQGAK